MIGEIQTLYERPLTGARARQVKEVAISAGGIVNNRLFVVYDVSNPEKPTRVSQKQIRELAQLHASVASNGKVRIAHRREDFNLGDFRLNYDNSPDVHVDEFGDLTPVIDMGDEAAVSISEFGQRNNLRLVQKTISWHLGEGIHPKDRKNAPLHIVSTATMEYLNEKLEEIEKRPVGEDRLRPDILIEVDESQGENNWQELRTESGLVIPITRMAERCGVPGNDQRTGEKMVDVPLVYRQFSKSSKNKAVIGAYGYVELEPGKKASLKKGEVFEIIMAS